MVCKMLYVSECKNVTPEALHRVYKNIMEKSSGHRWLSIETLHKDQCIPFLKLIGITYINGRFSSNRDIEVYGFEDDEDVQVKPIIIDGSIEISLIHTFSEYDDCDFMLRLHETQEPLEKVKNMKGIVRIDISPE
ncbi:hypothetical protein PENTCL1PPCAC_22354 [Pristionchus entomophagus]|uniref:Uncharacterized protein n=1 Tax=Pristionchus entomophagus TaxID=358040 RepID=A0AAV5U1X3_9BILA|nr:hypothetical protein PENTCL1PPCAC_22354 [Pristionchus entomophagus]